MELTADLSRSIQIGAMRHRVAYRKLGRVTEHRISMLRNQAVDLLRHERIETTVPKAKDLRPFVERLITIAKRSLDGPEGNAGRSPRGARPRGYRGPRGRQQAVRHHRAAIPNATAVTRGCCASARRGDAADLASVELVGSEYNRTRTPTGPRATGEAEPRRVSATGSRQRRSGCAARRARAGRRAGGQTATAERKGTTPRKAGRS